LEARRIKAPFVEIKQPDIRLTAAPVNDEAAILTVSDYRAAFEDVLLEQVSFELGPKDKVALIGSNGTGKTTLLRDIYKNNNPSITISEAVKTAYLSQLNSEILHESNTILDEFLDAGFPTNQAVAEHLLNYGFEETDLRQRISALSGGEKNLLQLAMVAAGNANLLLLDEPTSHLDTYAQLALEKALNEYQGAILMVSHDFYTIVNCVDYVLILENKTLRKMSIRKFRKMIYANHFGQDYLETEQKKKTVETKIAIALKEGDIPLARTLSEELEELIALL
jgi:ATP-binding cassette subfamily F protein 3